MEEEMKQLTISSSLQRSIVFADKINMNKTFQQMLQNFPQLPLPQRQLEGFYSQYLNWNKIVDDDLEILDRLKEANNFSVVEKFGEWVRGILQKLRKFSNSGQGMGLDVKQIQKLLAENLPLFMATQAQALRQRITQTISNSLSKQNLQPVQFDNSQIVIFSKPEQRANFIFGIILQYTHHIILQYKAYYSLEDTSLLQTAVYECFGELEKSKQQCEVKKQKVEGKQSKKRRLFNFVFQTIVQSFSNHQKQVKQNNEIKSQQYRPKSIIKQPKVVDQLIDLVVKQAQNKQMIKKIGEQQQPQQQDKYQNLSVKIRNYEIKPVQLIQKGSSLLPSLTTKGLARVCAQKLGSMRDKSSKYEQMSQEEQEKVMKLAETILKSHIRHNVNKDDGLEAEEFLKIERFVNTCDEEIRIEIVEGIFTQNQKQLLVEILHAVSSQLKTTNCSPNVVSMLNRFTDSFSAIQVVDNRKSSIKSAIKRGINTTLSRLRSSSRDDTLPNIFYFLLALYQHFKQIYCPLVRRMLLKVCHQIQLRYIQFSRSNQQSKRFSLVHTLKLLQSRNIHRSGISNIITNQKPFRQKQLPLVNQKQEYFEQNTKDKLYSCEEAQKHLELELRRIHIFQFNKYYKDPPKMQLLKLSHSRNKKNVTILISGFMSEDTNKFQQWMGVLEPTYDSEIYALQWESKTIENMLQYVINTCKDLAFTGAGIGLIGGPWVKAALLLKEIVTKYHQNPFRPCFDVATITGMYFAELIINLFDGHFINLIGFSLGTQVMLSVMDKLKSKGKLHMINRVITLGGVADKNEMISLLQSQQQQQDEKQPTSISWTNVYCSTDNILRYLLKISMPSIDPIGLNEVNYPEYTSKSTIKQSNQMQLQPQHEKIQIQSISTQRIYQLDNMNATEFVDGHLSYRSNMRSIARLLGIKDE